MEWLMIAYYIGSAIILVYLFIDYFLTRGNVEALKDVNQKLRDKWAQTENLCRKLDVAIMWLIEEKGVTLEQSHSWVNPWYIVPLKNKYQREMEKAFNEVYAHREEIAHALLDALRQWDEEREANWESKKTKGKKK